MADKQGGEAEALPIVGNHFKNAKLALWVQSGRRLVEEHDLGFGDKRPPEGNALLHATRKFSGETPGGIGQFELLQHSVNAFFNFCFGQLGSLTQRQGYIVKRTQRIEECVILKHVAESHAAFTVRSLAALGDRLAVELDHTRIRLEEIGDTLQEYGLTDPTLANDRGDGCCRDIEIHTVQNPLRTKVLFETAYFQKGIHTTRGKK